MDAPCIAPSRVNQKIFAVLVESSSNRPYNEFLYPHVSFFTFIFAVLYRGCGMPMGQQIVFGWSDDKYFLGLHSRACERSGERHERERSGAVSGC